MSEKQPERDAEVADMCLLPPQRLSKLFDTHYSTVYLGRWKGQDIIWKECQIGYNFVYDCILNECDILRFLDQKFPAATFFMHLIGTRHTAGSKILLFKKASIDLFDFYATIPVANR